MTMVAGTVPILEGSGAVSAETLKRVRAAHDFVRETEHAHREAVRLYELAAAQADVERGNHDGSRIYAWLEANGIREWVPDHPQITVDLNSGTITYVAFRFDGPRDPAEMTTMPTGDLELRTVPLKQPPDTDTAAAIARAG